MEVTRRGFLSALSAFAATAVLDPERLLWKPGEKTIFIPPPGYRLLPIGEITRRMLETLKNDLTFSHMMNDVYGATLVEYRLGEIVVIQKPAFTIIQPPC